MKIYKAESGIVCDVNGCSRLAVYFVKKNETDKDSDSLKLCRRCAEELKSALEKEFNRGKKD